MPAHTPSRKMVIIEEGTLAGMAANDTFLKEFPILAKIKGATVPTGCGGCGARSNAARGQLFTEVKQSLAGMADDRRRLLKRMLNADKVRLTYKSGTRTLQHTF